MAVAHQHRTSGPGLVVDLLLGRFTSRFAGARGVRGGQLLARWAGRLSALSWSAGCGHQLGSMGGGGARPVVRQSPLLDDRAGTGLGGAATGACRRSICDGRVRPRCAPVVPIVSRSGAVVVVQ